MSITNYPPAPHQREALVAGLLITSQDRKYWIALSHCEALVPLYWKKLLSVFQNAEAIWHAPQRALEATGLPQRVAAELVATRGCVDPDRAIERVAQERLSTVMLGDASYPRPLSEIADPPYVLFVQGALLPEEPVGALGVVGTRKISPYGQSVLPPLVADCVRAGLTIVSGLALGIDGVAHETTIKNNGRTIAVIGSGIDRGSLYPRQHRLLADRIVESGGAIVSEYPPDAEPRDYHFPARNRIISGLSLGVLVCEAPRGSGALITAFAALDQNREIFAVPGPVPHPNSWGPHDLLKRGAIPVTEAQDILATLALVPPKNPSPLPEELPSSPPPLPLSFKTTTKGTVSPTTLLATLLAEGTLHVDELVRRSNLTAEVIVSTLVIMEMEGKVRNVGGMHYVLAHNN